METPAPSAGSQDSSDELARAAFKVQRTLFGTHVKGVAKEWQPLPPRAGAVRLWDAGVAWRELEPARGRVNWAAMDRAVDRAESTGAKDILWVHGSPPRWAARDPRASGLYGPGTSSAPKRDPYLSIIRRIAERYRGRITSYQVWNEANISIFYRGRADYLAELTKEARNTLAEADPDATLVGASTTVRSKGPVKAWYGRYAAALAERGWPVDAMAVHLYPLADEGPDERAEYIALMRRWLAERGWTGPLWDTEVNFGDRREFAEEEVVVSQKTASAWVARTYIDSLALGIDRTYWYAWNDHILGIDQVTELGGRVLPAGTAYLTIQRWLTGATWRGCKGELIAPTGRRGALTQCDLTDKWGNSGLIAFTHRGTAKLARPEALNQRCTLDGACLPVTKSRLTIGRAPVLLSLSG